MKKIICFILFCAFGFSHWAFAEATVPDVRLYALNCGTIDVKDFSSFSDKPYYPAEKRQLPDPCFLIKNPKGWLLWDLGLGDDYYQIKYEHKGYNMDFTVTQSLASQLRELGLTPNDIKYVAISHSHLDHTGNLTQFPKATLLLQRPEYKFIQKSQPTTKVEENTKKAVLMMPKIFLAGDYDVFGDGTVRILSLPGHTPGHQSLEVKLPHTGVVILSGDLYHQRESHDAKLIPVFNTSKVDSVQSMAKMERILESTHGRLIVQHDAKDYNALPKFPGYLN